MDRIIVYPGAIPLDTDMLNTNRNTMIALHALISATLGTTVAVDGLGVTATVPASMQVTVGQGCITQYGALDNTPYGSLPADVTDSVVKMGVLVTPQVFTITAPITAGSSIAYLLEASFSEADQGLVVLPYYNAANPVMPYLGPGNDGAAQATLRRQQVSLQLKAGSAAPTGTQIVPPVDAGWAGLATIVVAAGATQVTQANISTVQATRFTPWKLPDLTPGFSSVEAFSASGTFVVPNSVSRLRVTVVGAGGAGGSSLSASIGAGGGGAGGKGTVWLTGMVAGTPIPATVGSSGVAVPGGTGNPGGTSSFGTYCSATGGGGGTGGSFSGVGGLGGSISGGSIFFTGSPGSDGVPGIARGGDGGGPGGGKGSSSGANGANALNWGGGGGGASGAGYNGGSGGGGLVIVEW